jgi:hypothetical protein
MEKKEIPMRNRVLGRVVTTALSVGMLGALGTLASGDQAKPRGQSGSSGSSGGGVRQHSPSGGSSSPNPGRSGSSGGYSGGSSRPLSPAESRHPRAGTGTGYRGYGYSGHGYSPYYYAPGWGYWYNPGYYPGYYYGYWPYWGGGLAYGMGYGYGYGMGGYWGGGYSSGGYYGAPYAYRSGHDSDAAALRLLVDPEDAKVYVDGYYAGEVDDFDGLMQRLTLAPGRHEILLKKDGYRTHRIKLYLESNTTVKVRYDMEKGLGPDTLEDLAGDRGLEEERRRSARRAEEESSPGRSAEAEGLEPSREGGQPTLRLPAPGPEGSATPGLLALRVSPDDASVYVDGRFFGSARQTGEIELSPGPHRVEIVRPGYKTIEREVAIESGRTLTLGMALDRP